MDDFFEYGLGFLDDDDDDEDGDIDVRNRDCDKCFEEISDTGIRQEYGHKKSKHRSNFRNRGGRGYFDGFDDNMHHHRKEGVGETIMSDDPIRSRYGDGGSSLFGGGERGFSFDFNDMRRSPTARHYETRDHRALHDNYDEYYDDYYDYGYDDDESDWEQEHDSDDEEVFPLPEPAPAKKKPAKQPETGAEGDKKPEDVKPKLAEPH